MQTTISLTDQAYANLKPLHFSIERIARATSLTPTPSAATGAVWFNNHWILPHAPKKQYTIYISRGVLQALRELAAANGYWFGSHGNVSALLEAVGCRLYEVFP